MALKETCLTLKLSGKQKSPFIVSPSLTTHSSPIFLHNISANYNKSTDMKLIRAFFEFFDFSENGDRGSSSYESWLFLCSSAGLESDEMYNVIESDEGEKIYPKYESVCQSLIDAFGSDIRKTLAKSDISAIWHFSRSLLFLKWFMASTGSEALTIDRDTLWSPITSLLMDWNSDFNYNKFSFDLTKEKIKFLEEKGASLHYTKWPESLTSGAMKHAITFKLWREILEELGIDIQTFTKEEIDKGPLHQKGWSEGTLMNLFREPKLKNSNEDLSEWDEIDHCSKCGSRKPTFWDLYREAIRSGDFICEVDDDNVYNDEIEDDGEVSHHSRGGDDDDKLRVKNEVSENDDDDEEISENDEVSNDDESSDGDETHHKSDARASDEFSSGEITDNEVYILRLCDSCYEALTFNLEHPIPGSFDPR